MLVHNLYNVDEQSDRKRQLFRRAGSVPLGCGHIIIQPDLMEEWLDFAKEHGCVVTLGENWMSQRAPLAGRVMKFRKTCDILGQALAKRNMTLYAFISDAERTDKTELRLAESIMWQSLMTEQFPEAKQVDFYLRCHIWDPLLKKATWSPYDPGEPFLPRTINPVWYCPQMTKDWIRAIQVVFDDAKNLSLAVGEQIEMIPWVATFAATYQEVEGEGLVFSEYPKGTPKQSEWLGYMYSRILDECCAYYMFGDPRVGERGMEHWEAFLTGAGQ